MEIWRPSNQILMLESNDVEIIRVMGVDLSEKGESYIEYHLEEAVNEADGIINKMIYQNI